MITLYENLRTIVYTPFYLADRRGFWADEGLDVNIQLSPDPVETAIRIRKHSYFVFILPRKEPDVLSEEHTIRCASEHTEFSATNWRTFSLIEANLRSAEKRADCVSTLLAKWRT